MKKKDTNKKILTVIIIFSLIIILSLISYFQSNNQSETNIETPKQQDNYLYLNNPKMPLPNPSQNLNLENGEYVSAWNCYDDTDYGNAFACSNQDHKINGGAINFVPEFWYPKCPLGTDMMTCSNYLWAISNKLYKSCDPPIMTQSQGTRSTINYQGQTSTKMINSFNIKGNCYI